MSEATPKKGPPDELLHRYVDGELSADERSALAEAARTDASIAPKIEGLLEVRALVQDIASQASEGVDGDALFGRIQSQLDETTTSAESSADVSTESLRTKPGLRVIPGGATGRPGAIPPDVRRRRLIGAGIGALAVAAAAAIAFTQFTPDEPTVVAEDETPVVEPEIAPPEELADATPARTEVLEVDFGTNVGTIFAVDGDAGQRYAVVWLDDEGNVSSAPD